MNANGRSHDRPIELAARAIDVPLDAAEREELERHLATCATCAQGVATMRRHAAALAGPLAALPPRRVDDAVMAAIVAHPARTQRCLVLVAATALLLVALLGIAAAAGSFLVRNRPMPPQVVVPSPPAVIAETSPEPTAPASPRPLEDASPSPAQPSPQGTTTSALCRLPVTVGDPAQGRLTAGFVEIPSGVFTPDERGSIVQEPAAVAPYLDYLWRSEANPDRLGDGGPTYVAALDTWVPASPSLVDPAGGRYVYVAGDLDPSETGIDSVLRVVDIATGRETEMKTGGPYVPIAINAAGIYLAREYPESGRGGLWLLPSGATEVRALGDTSGRGWHIVGDVAWSGGPFESSLVRWDLGSGRRTTWLAGPPDGTAGRMATEASGTPIAWTNSKDGTRRLLRVPAAGRSTVLAEQEPGETGILTWLATAATDGDQFGTWLGGRDPRGGEVILQVTPSGTLEVHPVADAPDEVHPAGPCLQP